MNKYQFKTNIKCGGCIARITPYLNDRDEIKNWAVDTQSPDKLLTVETELLSHTAVCEIVAQAGFRAEPVS